MDDAFAPRLVGRMAVGISACSFMMRALLRVYVYAMPASIKHTTATHTTNDEHTLVWRRSLISGASRIVKKCVHFMR